MKVGTVSKVMLGGNADVSTKNGIIIDADVILGKAEGRTKDLKGLVLSNKLMFGKSVSRVKMATVSGVAPLILADAVSANVVELIAFGGTELVAETYIDTVTAEGKCEQVDSLDPTAVPTPTAPIDIVSNNGVLKYENYGLPVGYTKLEYIENTGSQYIDTGIKPNNNTKVEVVFKCDNTTTTYALVGGRDSSSGSERNAFIIWENVGNSMRFDYQSGSASDGSINTTDWNTIIKDGTSNTLNGVPLASNTSATFSCNYNLYLFAQNTAGGAGNSMRGSIKSVKIWQDGTTLSANLVPVKRNSDNAIGMFDTVTNTFKPNAASGTFVAGEEQAPYLYTDGTVETVTDNVGNTATCEMLLGVGNYTDLQEIVGGTVTRNVSIKVLDGTETWSQTTTNVVEAAIMTGQQYGETAMCSHLSYSSAGSFGAMADDSFKTGTATYKNKIYCKSSVYATDTTTWKQFLSTQYANGTPVIIAYPLETSATETATGQILTKAPVTATGSLTGLVVTAVSSSHTTPNPYEPLDINCNNGVLKYGNVSKNLFDEVYPDPTTAIKYMHLYLGPGTYTCSYSMPAHSSNASMIYFLKGSVSTGANNGANQVDANTPRTVTSTDGYVTIAYRTGGGFGLTGAVPSDYNCMIEAGSPATPYEPYKLDVYTDGTVETIQITGKNIFNKNNLTRIYGYIAVTGGNWTYTSGGYSIRIPCLPNTTYTARYNGNSTQTVLSLASTASDDIPVSGTPVAVTSSIRQDSPTINTPITITTSASDKWLIVAYNAASPQNADMADNLQIEIGSTATDYQPYHSDTATCEDLLSIGTYTDEQEVISGVVTKKVGVKVLNGTENWLYNANYSRFNIGNFLTNSLATTSFLITHGVSGSQNHNWRILSNNTLAFYDDLSWYADATAFKTWLATQYANGTPVIIVYPLDTATTEAATAQPMATTQGINTAVITQASMDVLELSVTYMAGVNATVEEIENAQLSPDVDVTIS